MIKFAFNLARVIHHRGVSRCGFAAAFTCDLPVNTLVVEYTGLVRLCPDATKVRSPNNDEFSYVQPANADNAAAVVIPFPYANMARFFGGVNNTTGKEEKS